MTTTLTHQTFTHPNGAICRFKNANTHEICNIIDSIAVYNMVITSPPWPTHNNASNKHGGVDDKEWQIICSSLATMCEKTNGVDGVRGAIDLPTTLLPSQRKVLIDCLQSVGLQVLGKGTQNLVGYRYAHGQTIPYEWWIVLDGKLSHENRTKLARKIYAVQPTLNTQGTPTKNSRSLTAWNQGVVKDHGTRNPDRPTQFVIEHLRTIMDNFLVTGHTVLDPYAGCGTTLEEALNRKINCIGVEFWPAYSSGIIERIKHVVRVTPNSRVSTYNRGTKAHAISLTVDTKNTIQLRSQEDEEKFGLVDRAVFISDYRIDPNKNRNVQSMFISHKYSRYTGRRASYLYRRPKQGELSEC